MTVRVPNICDDNNHNLLLFILLTLRTEYILVYLHWKVLVIIREKMKCVAICLMLSTCVYGIDKLEEDKLGKI